ncbi:MAG: hypothetical protein M1837_003981 [Sclerophora amabilis]|nr:MAG: hypothetical protein M1837_003981 [Sclerophora amabilis]
MAICRRRRTLTGKDNSDPGVETTPLRPFSAQDDLSQDDFSQQMDNFSQDDNERTQRILERVRELRGERLEKESPDWPDELRHSASPEVLPETPRRKQLSRDERL